MSFEFVIQDNVEIPKRTFEGTPRESQYPIDQMTRGQSFALSIEGEDAEDAKKKAAQKQSYFSSMAKRRGIKVVTRYFPEGEDDSGDPTLRVWHNGARTPEDDARDAARAAKRAQNKGEPVQTDEEEGLDL